MVIADIGVGDYGRCLASAITQGVSHSTFEPLLGASPPCRYQMLFRDRGTSGLQPTPAGIVRG